MARIVRTPYDRYVESARAWVRGLLAQRGVGAEHRLRADPIATGRGDRHLFDGPATRGVFDEKTGVLWSVDTFAAATTGAVHRVEDLPRELYDESFMLFNSLASPWHRWLDSVLYDRHVDSVEALAPRVVASAHGPVLVGDAIHDAFDRVRTLAGQPRMAPPGQELLDEILATVTAA